jgi:cytidylate kinase
MSNIVIGIEGLVGAGKTSICRCLTKQISNTVLVNGGNIYRAIVALILKNGSKLTELASNASNIDMKEMMDALGIELKIEDSETIVYSNGIKVDEDWIQSKEISLAVSSLGGRTNETKLFEFAKGIIDDLKKEYNVVLSGRGVLTIYPECDYHLFITASLDERVKRKMKQYEGKDEKEVRENIEKRDALQKEVGYYDIHSITKVIDVTECKSAEESTAKVLEVLKLGR